MYEKKLPILNPEPSNNQIQFKNRSTPGNKLSISLDLFRVIKVVTECLNWYELFSIHQSCRTDQL